MIGSKVVSDMMKAFIAAIIMLGIVYLLGVFAVVMIANIIAPTLVPWLGIVLGILYILGVSIILGVLNNTVGA